MTKPPARPRFPFTAPEHELIRRELGMHFSQLPSVADGLFLRNWPLVDLSPKEPVA